ncbi:MAG: DUF4124 domain-containing protein [Pseudomonadota bacterium]
MKLNHWIMACAVCIALPTLSYAEIYKWKDKNGQIRYSDTPPPSNIKLIDVNGKKILKSTGQQPLSNNPNVPPAPVPEAAAPNVNETAPVESPEDTAAQIRQQNAETEKRNKQEKEAQAKLKAENCKVAKANFESYSQGGRIYKMNEKGEREYMGDTELKQGADKARAEMAQYCN